MKLNWFSPLPPAPTGIAEYTGTLLPSLCSQVDVTAWTDQDTWDRSLEKHCKVRQYAVGEISWAELNLADLSVFHLGNHCDFHAAIWELNRRHAGVVVLHDLRLQDFFRGVFAKKADGSREYIRIMERTYGPAGGETARDVVEGRQSVDSICLRYPLTAAVIENALGVVV